jgi:hypothetical protein
MCLSETSRSPWGTETECNTLVPDKCWWCEFVGANTVRVVLRTLQNLYESLCWHLICKAKLPLSPRPQQIMTAAKQKKKKSAKYYFSYLCLFIFPNNTTIYVSYIQLYVILLHVSAVYFSHHQVELLAHFCGRVFLPDGDWNRQPN